MSYEVYTGTVVALSWIWFVVCFFFLFLFVFVFLFFVFFFFNDPATTEIYTLSLHDALPIYRWGCEFGSTKATLLVKRADASGGAISPLTLCISLEQCLSSFKISSADRKSTRLNSSHANISYAVFCLKKKKKNTKYNHRTEQ